MVSSRPARKRQMEGGSSYYMGGSGSCRHKFLSWSAMMSKLLKVISASSYIFSSSSNSKTRSIWNTMNLCAKGLYLAHYKRFWLQQYGSAYHTENQKGSTLDIGLILVQIRGTLRLVWSRSLCSYTCYRAVDCSYELVWDDKMPIGGSISLLI
jgi:hypothetical protein